MIIPSISEGEMIFLASRFWRLHSFFGSWPTHLLCSKWVIATFLLWSIPNIPFPYLCLLLLPPSFFEGDPQGYISPMWTTQESAHFTLGSLMSIPWKAPQPCNVADSIILVSGLRDLWRTIVSTASHNDRTHSAYLGSLVIYMDYFIMIKQFTINVYFLTSLLLSLPLSILLLFL